MKFKLKDFDSNLLEYNVVINGSTGSTGSNNTSLINVKYNSEELDFQTPKTIIEKIIKENNKEYLLLKLIPTNATQTFYNKILNIEKSINESINGTSNKDWFNKNLPIENIKSVFEYLNGNNEIYLRVKIPFKYSRPLVSIYSGESLFNYYQLREGMEIICLLSINKLWINYDNAFSYNVVAKEISIK
jgi:hypothetical protein